MILNLLRAALVGMGMFCFACVPSRKEAKQKQQEHQKKINRVVASLQQEMEVPFRVLSVSPAPAITRVVTEVFQPDPSNRFQMKKASSLVLPMRLSSKAKKIDLSYSQTLDFVDVLIQARGRTDFLEKSEAYRIPLLVEESRAGGYFETNIYRATFLCEADTPDSSCQFEIPNAILANYSELEPGKPKDLELFPRFSPTGVQALSQNKKNLILRFVKLPPRSFPDSQWSPTEVVKKLQYPLNSSELEPLQKIQSALLASYQQKAHYPNPFEFVTLGVADSQLVSLAVADRAETLFLKKRSLSQALIANGWIRVYQEPDLELFSPAPSQKKEFWNLFHVGLLQTLTSVQFPLFQNPRLGLQISSHPGALTSLLNHLSQLKSEEELKHFSHWLSSKDLALENLQERSLIQEIQQQIVKQFSASFPVQVFEPKKGPPLVQAFMAPLPQQDLLFFKQGRASYYAASLEVTLKGAYQKFERSPVLLDQAKWLVGVSPEGKEEVEGYRVFGLPPPAIPAWIKKHFSRKGPLSLRSFESRSFKNLNWTRMVFEREYSLSPSP